MIVLASDHGGFELKEHLKNHLKRRGFEYFDAGNKNFDVNDDYPDFAIPAIKKILEDPEGSRGIFCCRTGTGEVIVANRFPGIRATITWSQEHAVASRIHNNTNVLALPADYLSIEEAQKIVDVWIATGFTKEERHVRRLKKIEGATKKGTKEKIASLA